MGGGLGGKNPPRDGRVANVHEKILVCGGAGYIGSHMVLMLARAGFKVVTLDNLSTGHRDAVKAGEFVQGDVRDAAILDALWARHRFDAVFHFAGLSVVADSVVQPELYYDNNVGGVVCLLAAMVRHGCRRLIFSSTAAVYGNPQQVPIREDHKAAPINPYGQTKLQAEVLMREASATWGLGLVSLRYFNAAGCDAAAGLTERHDPETHLIPSILAAVRQKTVVSVYGCDYATPDGTCVRDFVHVADLCEAHLKALEYLNAHIGAHTFNLGNGRGFSVLEVIAAAERVVGEGITYRVVGPRPGDPAVLVADAVLAERELRWRPRYTRLDDIIASAWESQ